VQDDLDRVNALHTWDFTAFRREDGTLLICDARAPAAGVVTFIRAVPSMTKGETIASIGVVAQRAP
jgi:hypothetical protein